ncbi:hypothetical protein F5B20DRAFT_588031 [Whalleya microplaca]|nr:hypothetical protein F5B20DRAFT_588031 [Whalleya microplaca]
MNKTKDTIKDFMHKSGHHDATVHETVQPAVQKETVNPIEREDINTAIDKEVHQDHYHRTVQPVFDKQVLPEQHKHNIGGIQHREYDHRDLDKTKNSLAAEGQNFRDERTVHDTTHTQSHAPVVQGEHVHHHLHETIQPVVHKETVQPSVVHTTVPIHEVHHNSAQHHSMSALQPVTMDEYKKKGGVLGGRDERFDAFKGDPKDLKEMLEITHRNKESGSHHENPPKGVHHGDFEPLDGGGEHQVSGGVSSVSIGEKRGSGAAATAAATASHKRATGSAPSDGTTKIGRASDQLITQKAQDEYKKRESGTGTGRRSIGTDGVHNFPASEKAHKPSLLDKLNPLTDSNGDGKTGFMK